MVNLEWVGRQWLNVVNSSDFTLSKDPLSCTDNRTVGLSAILRWGRDHLKSSYVDPASKRLCSGGRGTYGDGRNVCITSQWNEISPTARKAATTVNNLHKRDSDADAGARWRLSKLALDLRNCDAWMGFTIKTDVYDLLRDNPLNLHDEGKPKEGTDIFAVAFGSSNKVYCLVLKYNTGHRPTYLSQIPEPGSIATMVVGLVGLVRLATKRK